jgi:hypothetical protein
MLASQTPNGLFNQSLRLSQPPLAMVHHWKPSFHERNTSLVGRAFKSSAYQERGGKPILLIFIFFYFLMH